MVNTNVSDTVDIVILGGGIAGLSIARQLKRKMPDKTITVLERNVYPLPEAAIKVGESTVEMGARYYAHTLGLKQHLIREHFQKLGLRYFFPQNDNTDVTKRYEMGSAQLPTPVPTYQIDRGRFENHLYDINQKKGIMIITPAIIKDIHLSDDKCKNHIIYYQKNDQSYELQARWVVDATGRFSFLKRKLNLHKPLQHDSSAAWFRLKSVVDVGTWSKDKLWGQRSPYGQRYYSTNHLMGKGYWVWLIPLSSGATSIGVVYDPKIHHVNHFENFDTTLEWLAIHEPQCYLNIKDLKDKLLDFRRLKHYAYSCQKLYSENRWYITGEAGVFADPFYSPGNDFIALGNTYITDLIYRDSNGESISNRISLYNNTYIEYFNILLLHFDGHYKNFDSPYLMIQKILWDTICAFGVPYLLFYKNKFCDLDFMSTVGLDAFKTYKELTTRVQNHFIENADKYKKIRLENNFLNFSDIIHSKYYGGRIYKQLYVEKKISDGDLKREINSNLTLMKKLANDIINYKCIVPDFYINGDGNKYDLWRVTQSQVVNNV